MVSGCTPVASATALIPPRPICCASTPTAAVIAAGHDLTQNIRRGHYELTVDASPALRLMTAFGELARAI
jgi:hypothetical protein